MAIKQFADRLRAKQDTTTPKSGVGKIIHRIGQALALFMAVIIIGILGTGLYGSMNRDAPSRFKFETGEEYCQRGDTLAATIAAQSYIKKKLHNPSSASFNNDVEAGHYRKSGTFGVRGTLRASNAFGATILSTYGVELRCIPSKKSYTIINANIFQ